MTAHEAELKMKMLCALDGDASAYHALLRLLAPQLRGFFRRRVAGEEVAEDLVQETLIALHTRRGTFDRDRPFLTWLYAIARYKLADHFRRTYRSAQPDEVDLEIAGPDFESPASAALDIERLLETLPEKQRSAIRAAKIEGLSMAEIADAAGISQSDAKMTIYRGLKRLTARVRENPNDE